VLLLLLLLLLLGTGSSGIGVDGSGGGGGEGEERGTVSCCTKALMVEWARMSTPAWKREGRGK